MPSQQLNSLLRRQGNVGVALFISLVLLLMLTIVGVSTVQTTTLEVRMARNEHDGMLAFQAAELALRDGEAAVDALATLDGFVDSGANGLWTLASPGAAQRWEQPGVWGAGSTSSVAAPTPMGSVGSQLQPRFMIEYLTSVLPVPAPAPVSAPDPDSAPDTDSGLPALPVQVFRITARGIGGSENAVTLLQSTYGRVMSDSAEGEGALAVVGPGRLSWRELN